MITAFIKLDEANRYVYDDGELPTAARWDKELLTYAVSKSLISEEAYKILPPSMQKVAHITHGEPTLPIKVPEIAGLADLLIVTKVTISPRSGKKFRFDDFERIVKTGGLEIWIRKNSTNTKDITSES